MRARAGREGHQGLEGRGALPRPVRGQPGRGALGGGARLRPDDPAGGRTADRRHPRPAHRRLRPPRAHRSDDPAGADRRGGRRQDVGVRPADRRTRRHRPPRAGAVPALLVGPGGAAVRVDDRRAAHRLPLRRLGEARQGGRRRAGPAPRAPRPGRPGRDGRPGHGAAAHRRGDRGPVLRAELPDGHVRRGQRRPRAAAGPRRAAAAAARRGEPRLPPRPRTRRRPRPAGADGRPAAREPGRSAGRGAAHAAHALPRGGPRRRTGPR